MKRVSLSSGRRQHPAAKLTQAILAKAFRGEPVPTEAELRLAFFAQQRAEARLSEMAVRGQCRLEPLMDSGDCFLIWPLVYEGMSFVLSQHIWPFRNESPRHLTLFVFARSL